jgi:hypothetical protein
MSYGLDASMLSVAFYFMARLRDYGIPRVLDNAQPLSFY